MRRPLRRLWTSAAANSSRQRHALPWATKATATQVVIRQRLEDGIDALKDATASVDSFPYPDLSVLLRLLKFRCATDRMESEIAMSSRFKVSVYATRKTCCLMKYVGGLQAHDSGVFLVILGLCPGPTHSRAIGLAKRR
jgi:hypothetical protein